MIDPRQALRGLLRIMGQDTPADASTSRLTGVSDKPTITDTFEMGPEQAKSWFQQIVHDKKPAYKAKQREGVKYKTSHIILPDNSYMVKKETSTPVTQTARDLHGPGYSNISFQHSQGGYDQEVVKNWNKYQTQSFPPDTQAGFIQDYYRNYLRPAGLEAALGRTLNDIAIGKDVGWSAAEMDGKGRARERLYMRRTKGMFAIPQQMAEAISRKVGTDKWLPHESEDASINQEQRVPGS